VDDSDSTDRDAVMEELGPVRDGAKLLETSDTMGGFLRLRACGVCGQNNLIKLRRGRLPSECDHISLKPVRPTESMSLPGRPFLLKVFLSAAGALRQRERVRTLNGI
jgi:hypothetical protein